MMRRSRSGRGGRAGRGVSVANSASSHDRWGAAGRQPTLVLLRLGPPLLRPLAGTSNKPWAELRECNEGSGAPDTLRGHKNPGLRSFVAAPAACRGERDRPVDNRNHIGRWLIGGMNPIFVIFGSWLPRPKLMGFTGPYFWL